MIQVRNAIEGVGYRRVLKPVFFLQDPEDIHDRMVRAGHVLGRSALAKDVLRVMFGYAHPALEQDLLGIQFANPVGLAAGFDKDALLTQVLGSVGFGHMEVGSVTGEPCEGNPRPRLWRLKKSRGLVVYYGLKNEGAQAISSRLKGMDFEIPVGISIAKTNSPATIKTKAGIADYLKAYRAFKGIGHYDTINISCPNTHGGEPFTDAKKLQRLLSAIAKVRHEKPLFLKLAPDLSHGQVDAILDVAENFDVDGFICTNLTKKRPKHLKELHIPDKGGISGKPLQKQSDDMITYVYRRTKGRKIIIGCGGISSAQDAYSKIKKGASLLQLITGMIFEGPQVISSINHGLVRLLRKDGYDTIGQAVGAAQD